MFKLAQDRSMRTYDKNGHMLVEKTVISKAVVNPYRGNEIPNHEALGLDPNKIYNLLRDPAELQTAVPTFRSVQLMVKHIPVDASEPQKEYTIGTVGSDVTMDGDNVYASLRVWDDEAIRLIESGKLSELSAGYYYDADMTQGEYNGEQYDGIMRNIHGNHVALVDRGRIGRDAVIADQMPTHMVGIKMALKKGAYTKIGKKAKTALGLDEDIPLEALEAIVEAVQDETVETAEDEDDPKQDDPAEDEDEGDKKDPESAEDEADEEDDKKAPAMDADTIRKQVMQEAKDSHLALKRVQPLVGEMSFDSAENIYRKALKQSGINYKGNDLEAMGLLIDAKVESKKRSGMATDSAQPQTDLPDNLKKFM